MQFMQQFSTEVFGKGVVLCKDTPNFIANRIGIYGFLSTLHRALNEGYSVSEVDTILGPSMGRPRSAVFRTADLSGLDTTVHVADNLYENAPGDAERETFRVPEVIREMIRRAHSHKGCRQRVLLYPTLTDQRYERRRTWDAPY